MMRKSLREIAERLNEELLRQSICAMGRTAPNPSVACVVLRCEDNAYNIFSGGTEPAGGRHAEVVALDKYDDFASNNRTDKLSLYVTLEPCSRYGLTPPCTERILRYPELKNVTIYSLDPSLSGSGIAALRKKNIRVKTVIRPDYSETFFQGFLKRAKGKGPRYHIKAAITEDGYISGAPENGRLYISGVNALRIGMILRAKTDAVLAGPGTIACDIPGLDFRLHSNSLEKYAAVLKLAGGDTFTDLLLKYSEEIENIASAEGAFQPERVFILGRDFNGSNEFFEKQRRISESTGKMAVFCALASCRSIWEKSLPDLNVLPDLNDTAFPRELRGFLSGRGLNEILIEGGRSIFDAVSKEPESGDRLYIFQSRKKNDKSLHSNGKKIPSSFMEIKSKGVYDLGEDILYVKEMRDTVKL